MNAASLGSRLRSWWRAVTRRSRLEQEMDAELRFHLESYTEYLVRSGAPKGEAARRANLEFGALALHKEDMRASLGLRLWDEVCADLHYTARLLRKSPRFAAVALISLALGIGANTSIFSLANHILLERLHVPSAGQLRLLSITQPRQGSVVHRFWGSMSGAADSYTTTSFAYPVYRQLRSNNRWLEDLFAFKGISRWTATIDGNGEIASGELVSGNYYRQLQIAPQLGRAIQEEDDAVPGSGAVALISDGFWARRFGRSPSVIGKTVALNLVPVTIIGVNPPGFTGAQNAQSSPDFFVPISMQPLLVPRHDGSLLGKNDLWWVQIMARRKPGVPLKTALAGLQVVLDGAVKNTLPVRPKDKLPRLNLDDGSQGTNAAAQEMREPILVLMALVGFVLLLACVNIANLLLARSAARQREMSVRFALGAGRGRVIRQVLTECLALSLVGGALGLLLGYLGRQGIPALLANSWGAAAAPPPLDWRVLVFTVSVSLFTGMIFGLAPALQAAHVDIISGLKDSTQTTTHRRSGYAGKWIVAFQVALSTLLVVAAGLFVATVVSLGRADLGFDPDNILLFEVEPPASRYAAPRDVAVVRRLEERLRALPGVESVGVSTLPLLSGSMSNDYFVPEGEQRKSGYENLADTNAVGEQFFAAMKIPIVGGRTFDAHDTETAPKVAVVNRALVRKFFPNTNAIGKFFNDHIQIVGISGDAKYDQLRDEPPPTYYVPYRQEKDLAYGATFEIRTRLKPEAMAASVRAAVRSVDPDLPLIELRTQKQQIAASMQRERIFGELTGGFGVLALLLACIGIYGVMSYSVARRTNEIGIRIALGARARQVLTMILGEASWLALAGVATGIAAALALGRFIESLLYGVKARDPVTFLGAALLLFAMAFLAGWVPARRAARVQPMDALRHE